MLSRALPDPDRPAADEEDDGDVLPALEDLQDQLGRALRRLDDVVGHPGSQEPDDGRGDRDDDRDPPAA